MWHIKDYPVTSKDTTSVSFHLNTFNTYEIYIFNTSILSR